MLEQALTNVFGDKNPRKDDLLILFREIDASDDHFNYNPSFRTEKVSLGRFEVSRKKSFWNWKKTIYEVYDSMAKKGYKLNVENNRLREIFRFSPIHSGVLPCFYFEEYRV